MECRVIVLDQASRTEYLDYQQVMRSSASVDEHYVPVLAQEFDLVEV